MNDRHLGLSLGILAIFVGITYQINAITTLERNDPYPIFSANQPWNLLSRDEKQELKKYPQHQDLMYDGCSSTETFGLVIAPFWQKASRGRNFEKQKVPIGDMQGRWNMLGLLYGPICTEAQQDPDTFLGMAKQAIFPFVGITQPIPKSELIIDEDQLVGYFSVPIRYRKSGARFMGSVRFFQDFGLTAYGGVAEIKQTVTMLENLTPEIDTNVSATTLNAINETLMDKCIADQIFKEIGLDPCDFEESSVEDWYFGLWWRHPFVINANKDPLDWAHFLLTPFFVFDVAAPTARPQDRKKLFAIPFGNDRHPGVGCTTGLMIDFIETIEIGFIGGMMHFFERTIEDFRLPSQFKQSGIYPCTATVDRRPGHNWFFHMQLTAYHFLERLSFYAQYNVINHQEDKINLTNPNQPIGPNSTPADQIFTQQLIDQFECLTKFKNQSLNTCLYYDIAPTVQLGFVVQWPIMQRNTYRSTTALGSIRFIF